MLTPAPVTTAPLATCRVLAQAERTAALAASLGVALRTLHGLTADCDTCPLHPQCACQGWNTSLDAALRDIAGEWGLI